MRPINEKERSVAYFQFLLLFIFSMILTAAIVFFNQKFSRSDYDELKNKVAQVDSMNANVNQLVQNMDTLQSQIKALSSFPASEIDLRSTATMDNLRKSILMSNSATDPLNPIREQINKSYTEWIFDKKNLKDIDKYKQKFSELKEMHDKLLEFAGKSIPSDILSNYKYP